MTPGSDSGSPSSTLGGTFFAPFLHSLPSSSTLLSLTVTFLSAFCSLLLHALSSLVLFSSSISISHFPFLLPFLPHVCSSHTIKAKAFAYSQTMSSTLLLHFFFCLNLDPALSAFSVFSALSRIMTAYLCVFQTVCGKQTLCHIVQVIHIVNIVHTVVCVVCVCRLQ